MLVSDTEQRYTKVSLNDLAEDEPWFLPRVDGHWAAEKTLLDLTPGLPGRGPTHLSSPLAQRPRQASVLTPDVGLHTLAGPAEIRTLTQDKAVLKRKPSHFPTMGWNRF